MEYLVLLPLLVLAALVLGPVAFFRTRRLEHEVERLRAEVAALRARPAPERPTAAGEEAAAPGPGPAAEPAAEPAPAAPIPVAPPPEAAAPPPAAPAAPAARGGPGIEERLTSRWLVWLGGVALALGGVFLVRYTLEAGLLGPAARVALGLVLGFLLVAAGEWLLRRPLPAQGSRVDYVPPALTAAGIVTLLGTLYSAHALYGLVSATVTFPLLAAVAASAVTLSLRQGPLIAALGVLAGFLVPALVGPAGRPSPWPLFGYLVLLVAGALAIARRRPWGWLPWLTWLGAVLWPLLWIVELFGRWESDDALAVGGYLVLICALFALAVEPGTARRGGPLARLAAIPPGTWLVGLAGASTALLMLLVVGTDDYGTASLIPAVALVAVMSAVARWRRCHHALPVIGAALGVAILATWYVPPVGAGGDPLGFDLPGPVLPGAVRPFALTGIAFGLLTGGGGFLALWGAARPGLWAAVSATAPVALLGAAYLRLHGIGLDVAWSAAALALAAVLVAAAGRVGRRRDEPGMTAALAAYAIGVVAALSLAATMALEEAWLTVALALQVPAIAWVQGRLALPPLRRVAAVVAGIVLVRLALNPYVLDYPLGPGPALNWLLYGYGVPAAAFLFAAHLLRRQQGSDGVVALLEGGGLAFVVLLVSLQIRALVYGDLRTPGWSLLDTSLRSIAWLAVGFALFRARAARDRTAVWWGGRLLAGLAAAQVVALQVVELNPLWHPVAVGGRPVANLLLLAYLAPAAFAVLYAREAERQGERVIAAVAGLLALGLPLLWLTLEVRRAFQGPVLALGTTPPASDAEWYAYSVAWLAYAGLLLALGMASGRAVLRYASLLLLLVTVAKVFLLDMAALTGLYRAASFIGLGLGLVGVGWLYQRFVFAPSPRGAAGGGGT